MEATTATARGDEPRGPEEIQADIEQTRQELGETVEALTAKLDVKARARERLGAGKAGVARRAEAARAASSGLVMSARGAATDGRGRPKPAVAFGALAVAAVAGLLVWKRRRR